MDKLWLKPGRDRSAKARHPWIFSGAVARLEGAPQNGGTVEVRTAGGERLGLAAYSQGSQIVARMWTWSVGEEVDSGLIRLRIRKAHDLRQALKIEAETDAYRLIHGESDGLPGLVVDRYANVLVAQFGSAGAEYWRKDIVAALAEIPGVESVYERSDVDVRRLEGLPEQSGTLHGPDPGGPFEISENGLQFVVDVRSGQKTGFYLDQRRNRQRLRQLVNGRRVLNCFSYTGAFTVYALAGGAEQVLSIDTSGEALAVGAQNVVLNGLPTDRAGWNEGDVFQVLRTMRDRGQSFDAIVLDPPKFAPTTAQAQKAARGYKDINLLAFKLLRPGGLLFTFSCSGGIPAELFQKIVAGAALDAGVDARIIGRLDQGPDHPVALNFPEGAYLKGLIAAVL